jgi:hypothetical protein
MTKAEVEQIFEPNTFAPLLLTTKDGFALPVAKAGDALVGLRTIFVKHDGRVYQIPFHAIDHVSEQGEHLG